MAGIFSDFTVNFGGGNSNVPTPAAVLGVSPTVFTLADTVTVTINMNKKLSWKRIEPLSSKGEALLLDHEQGHYDLTALMARDCFIDLMQLKAKTFPNQQAVQKEANDIVSAYQKKLKAMQKLYDDKTRHGAWVTPSFGARGMGERKETDQNQWEFWIQTAKTEERQSPMTAPDGTPYKVTILKVLEDKGNFVFK